MTTTDAQPAVALLVRHAFAFAADRLAGVPSETFHVAVVAYLHADDPRIGPFRRLHSTLAAALYAASLRDAERLSKALDALEAAAEDVKWRQQQLHEDVPHTTERGYCTVCEQLNEDAEFDAHTQLAACLGDTSMRDLHEAARP